MPASWAVLRASCMDWPLSIPDSTTDVVEFSAPRKRSSRASPGAKPQRQALNTGTPSITADSCKYLRDVRAG